MPAIPSFPAYSHGIFRGMEAKRDREASALGQGRGRQRASPATPALFPLRFPGMVGGTFRRGSMNDLGIPWECADLP
jgi:hypothetical protein